MVVIALDYYFIMAILRGILDNFSFLMSFANDKMIICVFIVWKYMLQINFDAIISPFPLVKSCQFIRVNFNKHPSTIVPIGLLNSHNGPKWPSMGEAESAVASNIAIAVIRTCIDTCTRSVFIRILIIF
jgi:hypothetical protein